MICACCGDHDAPVIPLERRGLRRAKQYQGKAFCWECFYFECANNYLYNGKNPLGLRDTLLSDQLTRLNSKALSRINGGTFAEICTDTLMGVLLSYGGKSAISGRKGKLCFDHIIPLADGGNHTLENLLEEALYFAHDDDQRQKIIAKRNYSSVWDWVAEKWRFEVAA
jgi:hypothetical protein